MKTKTIVSSVMNRVMFFEKKRSTRWQSLFRAGMGIGAVLVIGATAATILQLIRQDTLSLGELLFEDREIIKEFWQDTLLSFFAEMPLDLILLGGTTIVLVGAIFVGTRKQRNRVKRKLREIAAFEKKLDSKEDEI
jgi:hypothetical protein